MWFRVGVSADVDIDGWLAEQGYGLAASKQLARGALEGAGLTRSGKQRLSTEKLARAQHVLDEQFFLHCSSADCMAFAKGTGKVLVACEPRTACGRCGGSTNQRAVTELLEAGAKRVAIVGGSPTLRQALESMVEGVALELRLVDGTRARPLDQAKADLLWADVVVLWGATELHHKVSNQYQDAAAQVPEWKRKLVHVPKRGIAQVLAGAIEHLRRR